MQAADLLPKNNKLISRLKAAVIIAIPPLLYLIPLEWIKEHESICLYKMVTGHECYGCGITRAVFSALHFHFSDAIEFNKLVIIVLPLLVYIWAMLVIKYLPFLKRNAA